MSVLPAERIHAFTVTVPAQTLEASPQETLLDFERAEVFGIEIVIPTGHKGLTGLALLISGRQMIPIDRGTWIQGNGDKLTIGLDRFPQGGLWMSSAFNSDAFEHSFYLRLFVGELVRRESLTAEPVLRPLAL